MSVKNEIDKDVLLVTQRYDNKLNNTLVKYFRFLLKRESPEKLLKYLNKEYVQINHDYMIESLEEIKQLVAKTDKLESIEDFRKVIPNLLELNPISKFQEKENEYAQRVLDKYVQDLTDMDNQDDVTQYLTTKINNYEQNVEQYIPYYRKGSNLVKSMQNLATYNSMLYNVNLTRTAWNQSYKDSILLDNKKFIINSHPFACPYCLKHQGQTFSRKEIENLVKDADVGSKEILHPNCKCTLGLFWDNSQLKRQNLTTKADYEIDQKAKAIQRNIERRKAEGKAYQIIGNDKMAEKRSKQISRMENELEGLNEQMKTIRQRFYSY